MNFPILKEWTSYSRVRRRGLTAFFLLIILLQFACFCLDFDKSEIPPDEHWLALQPKIDSLKLVLKQKIPKKNYPFNPNFISDHKGYMIGMTVAEIDRLHAFREQGKFVNSAQEFQQVTRVSDSLLKQISGQFKFPDWVTKKNERKKLDFPKKEVAAKTDINAATKDDLIKVYGIGPALSERILKFRESLGGFVSIDQLSDVWGLSPEVIEQLEKRYLVTVMPSVKKVDINGASIKELSAFPYFRYPISKEIVAFRSMNGPFKDVADLAKIKSLAPQKINIIAVYLEL